MPEQSLYLLLPGSFLSAVFIQIVTVLLPSRRSLASGWQQLRSLRRRKGRWLPLSPRLALRLILIWATAFILLWQTFRHVSDTTHIIVLASIGLYLLIIAIIDFDHHLVLNRMLAVSAPILILLSLLGFLSPLPTALLGGLIGLGLFGLLALIGRGALGMGDVKLAAWIGLLTGYPDILPALLLGIIAGGIAAAILLVAKRFQRKQAIAYAPYLALGAWIVLLQQFSA